MSSKSPRYLSDDKTRAGFTLIELLVVLAVLSLLMAILLPVLGKARTLSRRIVCRGHLRQITLAWDQYLTDHKGKFYRARENAEYTYGGWKGVYYPDAPRPLNKYCNIPEHAESETQAGLFKCCEDDGSMGFSAYKSLGTSYRTNILLIGQDQVSLLGSQELTKSINRILPTLTLQGVDKPSDVLLIGDFGWGDQWLPAPYPEGPAWHKRQYHYNLAFLDGHAEFLRIRKGVYYSHDYTVLPSKRLYSLAREVQQDVP